MHLAPWDRTLKIIACTFHSVAIASTVFRLMYRWYIARFWWEDGWAALALAADVACLASTALQATGTVQETLPVDNAAHWIAAMGFPCVLWACRTSILVSIVRVVNPTQRHRRAAFLVGCSFFVMWVALMGQKVEICVTNHCLISVSVGVSQLITDAISDGLLVALPIYSLRRTKISPRQRIMILSVFSASLLITVVTILHSAVLFTLQFDHGGIVVIGHVKAALSLVVCNLLVIVAFVYRTCHRGGDLDASEETVVFTTVDLEVYHTAASTVDKHTETAGRSSRVPGTSRSTTPGR